MDPKRAPGPLQLSDDGNKRRSSRHGGESDLVRICMLCNKIATGGRDKCEYVKFLVFLFQSKVLL